MTIAEFVKQFRNQKDPRQHETEHVLKTISAYCALDGIDLIQIFSTNVYPQYISSKKDDAIVWDGHFWDLFERFYFGIIYLQGETYDHSYAFDYFCSLTLLFLSCRFEKKPAMAYTIAHVYTKLGCIVPPYNKIEKESIRDRLGQHNGVINIAKLYVFFHERYHYLFKRKSQTVEQKKLLLIEKCGMLASISWPDEDLIIRNTAEKIALQRDPILTEEMCCDLYSFLDVFSFYKKIGEDTDEDIFRSIIVPLRYLFCFQSQFYQVERKLKYLEALIDNPIADFDHASTTEQYIDDTLAMSYARESLIILLAYHYIGIQPIELKYDFFGTLAYEQTLKPLFTFLSSYSFMNQLLTDYIDCMDHYSKNEFLAAFELLIGWH